MKIIYLYAELMPYQVIVFKELIKTYSAEIIAVHWDKKKLTPYELPITDGVIYKPKSFFKSKKELLNFVRLESPDIIYCSGWMDNDYRYVAKKIKRIGIPVIAGSDTQWRGGKQWFNVIFASIRHKRWFSHIWVSGIYQYEYARKLRFSKDKIIFNSLTADVSLFSNYGKLNLHKMPKNFVYIGRFDEKIKGLHTLVKAFKILKEDVNNPWRLICIGNGVLKEQLLKVKDIIVYDFMDQKDICMKSHEFGFLVLPSLFENWGLVLHEATCLGLPIISSKICGGNSTFLIDGYNGFSFSPNSVQDLVAVMKKVSSLSDDSLLRLRENSFRLHNRITPQITAASLMSVIKQV